MTGLLPPLDTYEKCYAAFHWQIPERFNIASAVCDRHAIATPSSPAVLFEDADGRTVTLTFDQLRREANRLANVLRHLGVQPGDRIAIHLPQCFDAAIAHVATYKLGAIALPLFSLFGPDALRHCAESLLIDSSSFSHGLNFCCILAHP